MRSLEVEAQVLGHHLVEQSHVRAGIDQRITSHITSIGKKADWYDWLAKVEECKVEIQVRRMNLTPWSSRFLTPVTRGLGKPFNFASLSASPDESPEAIKVSSWTAIHLPA